MTSLEWDQVGDKFYQTGVDRGVLGLKDGTVVAWNGLTGIDDGSDTEVKAYYLDGVKFLEHVTPGDFSGKLSAFTYPDEFDRVLGQAEIAPGLSVYEQPPETFNLSYRTRLGNDVTQDYGYKIHLFYNLSAVPDSFKYETASDKLSAGEFSWSITGIPATVFGKRSTVRITIDSQRTNPEVLSFLEKLLYGSDINDPSFPSILLVRQIFGELGGLSITDNGDGTWTANDPSSDFITMTSGSEFEIAHAITYWLDQEHETYQITDTANPLP